MSDSKKFNLPDKKDFGKMKFEDLIKLRERDWKESDFVGTNFCPPDIYPYFSELNKAISCREDDSNKFLAELCGQLCIVPEGLRDTFSKHLFTLLTETNKFIIVKNKHLHGTLFRYMEKLLEKK